PDHREPGIRKRCVGGKLRIARGAKMLVVSEVHLPVRYRQTDRKGGQQRGQSITPLVSQVVMNRLVQPIAQRILRPADDDEGGNVSRYRRGRRHPCRFPHQKERGEGDCIEQSNDRKGLLFAGVEGSELVSILENKLRRGGDRHFALLSSVR